MAKMPKNLQNWLIPHLRNISRYWPGKNIAKDRAKRKIPDGVFKNGNPKFLTRWECAGCRDLFELGEFDVDHIEPIANITGFIDWNTYIPKLYCDPNKLQILCKVCHLSKSLAEGEERKDSKNKAKNS